MNDVEKANERIKATRREYLLFFQKKCLYVVFVIDESNSNTY